MPDDNELFAIVPVQGTKSPPDAICVGPMSEVTKYISQSISRIEEEKRLAKAQEDAAETELKQQEVRECAAQILADGVAHLAERIDRYEAHRHEQMEQQKRIEEAAEAKAIEEMLNGLPDPESPQQAMGDDGEFEIKPPPDVERYHPEHRNESTTGMTPAELEKEVPSPPGDFTLTAPPPSPYRDPTSIGGP
jgi:hypothetical protein